MADKNNEVLEIKGNMTVASVLKLDENLSDVFMGFGMFCIFCHLSEDETIEEACKVHEIDTKLLLTKLNTQYEKDLKKNKSKNK